MLNMQNVKDIKITEGDVRTIHDKDSRLIWGRLAYDTKYAGDTYQQNYSGKNKINGSYSAISQAARCTAEVSGNGFKITSASSSGVPYVTVPIPNITALLGQTVTVSYVATGDGTRTRFYYLNSSGGATEGVGGTETATLPNSLGDNAGIGVVFYTSNNGSATYTDIQLEIGSTATSYELYTGGIPAPNPDYPQPIQVVTGEQTVTVSDGVDSEDFTISLGSLELCKIGDYQDYIYKSGDDWYVHKAVGKVVLDGSENWTVQTRTTSTWYANKPATLATGETRLLSNYFSDFETSILNLVGSGIVVGGALNIRNTTVTDGDTAGFKAWLSTHNPVIYYPSTTSTDTKITDATLVGQLNAVHEWLTRYGYTSTVTGNLPIIINQTNL